MTKTMRAVRTRLKHIEAVLKPSQGNRKINFKREIGSRCRVIRTNREDRMTHIDIDTIRRRPDGSVDTRYYLDRGRRKRSETAHRIARNGAKRSAIVLSGLLAFLASLPFPGAHG